MEARRSDAIEVRSGKAEEVSLLALGTTLVRSRWRILRWMLIGAIAAAAVILVRPRTYLASASFTTQGTDASSRSGLASLAGQMGIFLPAGNQSLSPDFYVSLLESRVVLLPIVRDTVAVAEEGGKRKPVLDLLGVGSGAPDKRAELGLIKLRRMVGVSVAKATGVVQVSVTTPWRSVSLFIVKELLDGVNDYNERTRKGQATAEREFVEGRLALASNELRAAENRLTDFLRNNRNVSPLGGPPDLVTSRDRLQRDVELRQQVYTTLTSAYEEARIREVRDMPVITIFEEPNAPSVPKPRGLLIGTILGFMVGGLIGVLLAFTSGLLTRRQESGSSDAEEFANAIREAKGQLFGGVRRLRGGMRSGVRGA